MTVGYCHCAIKLVGSVQCVNSTDLCCRLVKGVQYHTTVVLTQALMWELV
jgi:hypothetical protein